MNGTKPFNPSLAERHPPGVDYVAVTRRRYGAAPMAHRIVTLPGDGIGPEILAPALELLDSASADFDDRGAPVRRRVDRRRTAPR